MIDFCGLTLEELKGLMGQNGEKPFRAAQLFDWIYGKQASSFEDMTNLSKDFRAKLATLFRFPTLKCQRVLQSEDGQTDKFLWELSDGKRVESVLNLSW